MPDTIFDRILAGEIPSDPVYSDDIVYAFRDINPAAPVHVLVIPRDRKASFDELAEADPATIGRFFSRVSMIARELGLSGPGYRIVFNHGAHGQQTVQYLHAHIIGGRQLQWPPG